MHKTRATVAATAFLALIAGCAAEPGQDPVEPDGEFMVPFAWTDCPFLVVRTEVEPATLARLLPPGFLLGTYASNGSKDEAGKGHLYLHAVRCPDADGGEAVYAWWSTVVVPPPYLAEHGGAAYRFRFGFAWPGDVARRVLESARLDVTTADAEWSAASGLGWTGRVAFEAGATVGVNASAFEAAPSLRQRVVEFSLMGDGRLATWQATLSAPPGKIADGTLRAEGGPVWMAAALGPGSHPATIWLGSVTTEDADVRVPLGGW